MKTFPSKLHANNKANFPAINYARGLCYLRKTLYEHIISHEESEYFSIDDFIANFPQFKTQDAKKMLNELIQELIDIGWNCKLSFGGTALFIFAEKPPANCWEDMNT
jgi:hypothetical protein